MRHCPCILGLALGLLGFNQVIAADYDAVISDWRLAHPKIKGSMDRWAKGAFYPEAVGVGACLLAGREVSPLPAE